MRVKGWCYPYDVDLYKGDKSEAYDAIYVEEIPPDTVRVEGFVSYDAAMDECLLEAHVPAHLIGKRVSVIIIPEEKQP